MYLQGSGGDYIVGNRSYLYRQSDAAFTLSASDNYLSLRVAGDQDWTGDFKQSGSGARLSPGWGILTGHLVFLAVLVLRPEGLFAPPRRVD